MDRLHQTIAAIALCIHIAIPVSAQYPSWDTFVEQFLIDVEMEEQEDIGNAENILDEYMDMHTHPININRADTTLLRQLGFLTDRQIEGIHRYIYRYGALHHVGELMLIPELDYHTRQLLSYFTIFGAPEEDEINVHEEWHRLLTQGRSELSTRLDIPLYSRAGYMPRTQNQLKSSPSRYYMGNALYHNLRYNYRYGTRLSWGVSAEKDAGEPLFTPLQPVPDYLSGYLQIGDWGLLKNLVVGNYRLRFGQGLVMNTDFALGKTMVLQGLGKQSAALKPHRGSGESDYYTGVAATLAWRSWQLTAFASYRLLDATLKGSAISSLKTDGYHRTPTEIARKNNTRGNAYGLHLGYASHGIHIGATAMYQSFNRIFAPPTQNYRRYAPQGHTFYNASIDYAWHHHRLSISGETAIDKKGTMATLNMLRIRAADKLHITMLQRYYAHDYWGLEAKSFSTSSDIRNEQGIYLGAQWQPHRDLSLTAYIDGYHFPYLRYRVSSPSYGTDGVIAASYAMTPQHHLSLRYRFRMKQRNVAEGYLLPQGTLLHEWTHRLRTEWEGTLSSTLSMRALLEGCLVTAEKQSAGYLASIQANYTPTTHKHSLRLSTGLTAFHADYAARLYAYERGLLYAYNFQMYYGTGMRGYLLLQYSHHQAPRLTATAKIGATHYLDRTTIGTAAAMIDASHREDLQLQVRYTF